MLKSVASFWEKGSPFRVSESPDKRPFAEGLVYGLECEREFEQVTETVVNSRGVPQVLKYLRLRCTRLMVTADIWARNEDREFSDNARKLEKLLSRTMREVST